MGGELVERTASGTTQNAQNEEGKVMNKWSPYMASMYRSDRPPPLGTLDVQKVEDMAREKLKDYKGARSLQVGIAYMHVLSFPILQMRFGMSMGAPGLALHTVPIVLLSTNIG